MPTVSPSKEACEAIVAALNAATDFSTAFEATTAEFALQDLKDGENLSVEVIHEEEETLAEQLGDDQTRHRIEVQITGRRNPGGTDDVEDLKLLATEIEAFLDQWDSADGRVQVWYVNREPLSAADKQALREMDLFRRNLVLTVEVAP